MNRNPPPTSSTVGLFDNDLKLEMLRSGESFTDTTFINEISNVKPVIQSRLKILSPIMQSPRIGEFPTDSCTNENSLEQPSQETCLYKPICQIAAI